MSVAVLDFYYDVVCPYAYLASTRVEALAERCGVRVRWRPILLGGLLRTVGAPDDPNQTMVPAKAALLRHDRQRTAALYGVPLHHPEGHPQRTVEAMRLALAAPEGPVRVAVSRALFEAYWVEDKPINDPKVLADVAVRHGLDAEAHRDPTLRSGLREATAEAAAAGAFGVPSFVIDGRLYWGEDRMVLIERAIRGEVDALSLGQTSSSIAESEPVRLSFFHDFASPFSYLASTQLERIAAARGVTVEWIPILLGALFRAIGTPNVPLFEMNPTKQAYVRRDLDDWAAYWGVPFAFPEHFPLRSVLPLRVALAEPEATMPIYRAIWVEGVRVDDPESLAPVLRRAGFDAAALLERAQDPEIKAQLRANTDAAVAQKICGVPTMELHRGGRSELLWGQDRIDQVTALIDGVWPAAAGAAGP